MSPEQWQTVRNVFEAALQKAPSERGAWVAQECIATPEIGDEVNRLLAGHDHASQLFAQVRDSVEAPSLEENLSGRRVGQYQLLEPLGQGGMGVVYRASRADDAFERTVAVKLLGFRYALPDIERAFLKERQILATLDHAHIARLIDGGTTPEGLLYLVMEYIEGEPIDAYCHSRSLSIDGRLTLFQQVCDAVQHAHRRLIVHRDLKPRNIFVTREGGVKLLDFGIAKVLDESAPTGETMKGVMTPQYASPEQILGKPVTTASDVYSLGAVLFELLTDGRRPYETTGPLDETIAAICYKDAPRPSSVAPPGIAEELRGELDNIVLRAIQKDPERRYSSVEQLNEDIRRYRNGLPVLAQGDALTYRAAKFIRRRRVFVAAAALVLFSIAGGIIATRYEAQVAKRQRMLAEKRYEDVRSLATTVLFDIHDSIKNLPGATVARKLAIDKGLQYLEALARDAEGDERLQTELASGYERAGSLLGSLYDSRTEGSAAAMPVLTKAITIRKKVLAGKPNDVEAMAALGMSYLLYGNTQVGAGDFSSAIATYKEALAIPGSEAFREHRAWLRLRANGQSWLCNVYPVVGDLAAAASTCEDAVRLSGILAAANPQDKDLAHALLMNEGRLANVLRQSGKLAESIPHFRVALEKLKQLMTERPNDSSLHLTDSTLKFYLARSLHQLGEGSARDAYAEAVAGLEANLAAGAKDSRYVLILTYALSKYGELLERSSRGQEGAVAYGRGLSLGREMALKPKAGALEISSYAEALAKCPFPRLQDPALALQFAQRANEMTKGRTPSVLDTLAWAYYKNGRVDQAIRTARTALSLLPASDTSGGIRKDIEASLNHFESGNQARR